jgi:nephrocystin-4
MLQAQQASVRTASTPQQGLAAGLSVLQERQTLRSSLTMLESTAAVGAHTSSVLQQHAEAAPHPSTQQQLQAQQHRGSARVAAAAADCAWLSGVAETAHGNPACFSGEVLQEPYQGLTPSRAVLQQLHEAGMMHALPAGVQARLQAQAALSNLSLHQQQSNRSHPSRTAALLLDVEARGPRTASKVVLQLLSFRPASTPGAATSLLPSNLHRLYFTLQFYKSGPVVTDTCLLAASPQGQHMQGGAAGVQSPDTFLMLPQQQGAGGAPAGAGVVLKFSVDGSAPSELLPGQDPLQAAAAAHLAFCRFLVSHKLAVDLWDGDSLLQVWVDALLGGKPAQDSTDCLAIVLAANAWYGRAQLVCDLTQGTLTGY